MNDTSGPGSRAASVRIGAGQRTFERMLQLFQERFANLRSFATSISALSHPEQWRSLPYGSGTQPDGGSAAAGRLDNKLSMITGGLQGRYHSSLSIRPRTGDAPDTQLISDGRSPPFAESSTRLAGQTVKTFAAVAPQIPGKGALDKKAASAEKLSENGPRVHEVPRTPEQRGLVMRWQRRSERPRAASSAVTREMLNKDFRSFRTPRIWFRQGQPSSRDVRIATTIVVMQCSTRGRLLDASREGADTRLSRGEPVQRRRRSRRGTLALYEPLLGLRQR